MTMRVVNAPRTSYGRGTQAIGSTIGTGGDYTYPQDWADATVANLVTGNLAPIGLLLNQEFTGSFAQGGCTLAGATTNSTHFRHLTAAPGASFADHANKRTNPLRYNAAVGAAMLISTSSEGNPVVGLHEGYSRLSRVQIRSQGSSGVTYGSWAVHSSSSTYPVMMDQCILESGVKNNVLSFNFGYHVTRNCVVISTRPADAAEAIQRIAEQADRSQNFSTLFIAANARAPLFSVARDPTCLFRNCAIFGCDLLFDVALPGYVAPGPTFENCITDAVAALHPGGVLPDGCTYCALADAGFESFDFATRDFRLKSTSPLRGAGVIDTVNTVIDITGLARPVGSAPDVGPWQFQ